MSQVTADVYKSGNLAAYLVGSRADVEFRYVESYLHRGLPPVATTLPLSAEPRLYHGGAVPPYFAGLLPEGRRLTTLRRHLKVSADDELSMLLAIGSDTIGDVQVVPHGAPAARSEPLLEIPRDLTTVHFADLLADHGLIDPIGLPGVQDKVSGRMINLPAARAHEQLVVKLPPPEFPGVIENEAFFLDLARLAGLPTVKWKVVEDGEGTKALLVTRFDRVRHDGDVRALACEDSCQVLNLWPSSKYGVTMEEAAECLIQWCASPALAARDLFRQVVFAVLTGNGDLHAKNMSILATTEGEWRIGPAYDLPSTIPYGDHTFALSIQGSTQPYSRKILVGFATDIGLPRRAAEKVIDHLVATTERATSALVQGRLPFNQETLRDLGRTLDYRRRQLRQTR